MNKQLFFLCLYSFNQSLSTKLREQVNNYVIRGKIPLFVSKLLTKPKN